MARFMRRLRGVGSDFRHAEEGTASVEGVLWVPIFFVIFALMVDTSFIFNGQSHVLRVVQDANRHMSIRRFTTDLEVEAYITDRLAAQKITPKSVDTKSSNGVVVTTVIVPARQFQMLGLFSSLMNLEVDVSHAHILESIKKSELDSFGALVSTY